MATPRRPFVRLPLGIIDDALAKGLSIAAALLLALIVTHRARRSIPGSADDVRPFWFGRVGGRHEARRCQEGAGRPRGGAVGRHRLYRSAAAHLRARQHRGCSPVKENSVKSMAKQLTEMPISRVTDEVRQAVTASLQSSEWLRIWCDLTAGSATESGPGTNPESGRDSGPNRIPKVHLNADDTDTRTARVHRQHAACGPNGMWCVRQVVHDHLAGRISPRFGGHLADAARCFGSCIAPSGRSFRTKTLSSCGSTTSSFGAIRCRSRSGHRADRCRPRRPTWIGELTMSPSIMEVTASRSFRPPFERRDYLARLEEPLVVVSGVKRTRDGAASINRPSVES